MSGPAGASGPSRLVPLELDGRSLECRWIGPAGRGQPVLVFLHGGLACAEAWRGFPLALSAATGLSGLVFSRFGHGGSAPAPPPWSPRFMHREAFDVLPRVLGACGIEDPLLVGHSDGASIALLYAGATPPGAPRARALVLEAAHLFVEDVCLESIRALRARFGRDGRLRRSLEQQHGAQAGALVEAWCGVWLSPEFRSWSIEDAAAGFEGPALAVQGADDEYGTPAQLEAVVRNLRGETASHLLPGCRHVPHRDAAGTVLELATALVLRHAR